MRAERAANTLGAINPRRRGGIDVEVSTARFGRGEEREGTASVEGRSGFAHRAPLRTLPCAAARISSGASKV